jgi:hypothetical protein
MPGPKFAVEPATKVVFTGVMTTSNVSPNRPVVGFNVNEVGPVTVRVGVPVLVCPTPNADTVYVPSGVPLGTVKIMSPAPPAFSVTVDAGMSMVCAFPVNRTVKLGAGAGPNWVALRVTCVLAGVLVGTTLTRNRTRGFTTNALFLVTVVDPFTVTVRGPAKVSERICTLAVILPLTGL